MLTEGQDINGTLVRLTREGLIYGERFVPLKDVVGVRPDSFSLWNPATNLFEVAVVRRGGPDLVVKDLPLQTAEHLREAIAAALRERQS